MNQSEAPSSIHTIETLPAWEEVYRDCCRLCMAGQTEREVYSNHVDSAQLCESCYNVCQVCDERKADLLLDGERVCRECAQDTIQCEIDDAVSPQLIAMLQREMLAVSA